MHCNAVAAELFVSVQGSDEAPGTRDLPFRTLGHAARMAKVGDTVVIRGGIYRETLTMRNSGTKTHPITFTAADGERVIITGADLVRDFQPYQGGILQAKIPAALDQGFNQLFLNGKMMHEARFPNEQQDDPLRPTLIGMQAHKDRITSTALTQPDGFWEGGYVVGGFSHGWTFQSAKIRAFTNGVLVLNEKTSPWFEENGQGYVSGVLAALDTPGEWHIEEGRTLYFWPTEGTDMATANVELKQRTLCVDFNGQSHIRVNGLVIQSGSVRMVGNSNVLKDCTVSFPSHFTFFPWSGYVSDGGADSGHNGILVLGDNNVVRGCTIRHSAGSGIVLQGARNLIGRCEISDINYSGTYSAPITVRHDPERAIGNNRIWFNTIRRSGRDSIQLYGAFADDIRYNDISEAGLLCNDNGLIYVWGRDGKETRIAYNWIYNNRSKTNPGVYLDNYCSHFVVHHNVIWNCEAGVRVNRPAKGHRVYNNTLFNCGDIGSHTYNQWPNNTPAYWKANGYGNINEFDTANNLFLDHNPDSQLEDVGNRELWPKKGAPAIDAGKHILGFADEFAGRVPDLGAYERDRAYWLPGKNGRAEQSTASDVLKAEP